MPDPVFLSLLSEWCKKIGVEIWAYCLMPNHVHLIAVPERKESLARGIGEAHRRYTRHINFKKEWKGYLWQGRFASFPMDELYLLAAARYVELNPVRARLVEKAGEKEEDREIGIVSPELRNPAFRSKHTNAKADLELRCQTTQQLRPDPATLTGVLCLRYHAKSDGRPRYDPGITKQLNNSGLTPILTQK